MTSAEQPPDWVTKVPSTEGVHSMPPQGQQLEQLREQQVDAMRKQLLESIIQVVVQAITGLFIPGGIGSAVQQLQNWAEDIYEAIDDVPILGSLIEIITGIEDGNLNDFGTFWNNLMRALAGTVEATINDIIRRFQWIGTSGMVNAHAVQGNFNPRLIGSMPAGAVGSRNPNLLINATFDTAASMAEGQGWTWDSGTGHNGPGMARVVADGAENSLLTNEINVSPGQTLEIDVWTRFQGLVYSGSNPIAFGVTEYFGYEEGLSKDLVTLVSPASSSGWTNLGAEYTVPESGVDQIRLRLKIGANLQNGTVWWDDATAQLASLVPDDVIPGIGQIIDNIVNQLFGIDRYGWLHEDAAAALRAQNDAVLAAAGEVARIKSQLTTGVAASDDFEMTPSSTLGPFWDENYTSGNGSWALNGHAAYWDPVWPNGFRESILRYNGVIGATSTSDYQTIAIVLESAPTFDNWFGPWVGYNYVIGRIDLVEENYIKFAVGGNGWWYLSRITTDPPASKVETILASGTTRPPGRGSTLMLICGDKATSNPRSFTCMIGDEILTTTTDSTSKFGAGYRGWGFGGSTDSALFDFIPSMPGRVNAWVGRDT